MSSKDENLLWSPSGQQVSSTNLARYIDWLKTQKLLDFSDYHKLWEWSISSPDDFWLTILDYFDISYSGSYHQVRSKVDMPGVEWFKGIEISYAEHVFKNYTHDSPAIIYKSEQREASEISWQTLKSKVSKLKNYLLDLGIKKGDRVIGYLPNVPEATIAFLATNAIGAIWSSASPDFGLDALIDRFEQIAPKVLIASEGYFYNGKWYDKVNVVNALTQSITSITTTILIPKDEDLIDPTREREISWGKIMSTTSETPLTFERVDFNHPIWILYSSGTTGKPKAITHSQGGILLEHYKYLAFHQDVQIGERCFWYTTTGWMMWNYIQSTLLLGGTMVLYDGSPGYPSLNVLWQYADDQSITHFGTSAGFLLACDKANEKPSNKYQFEKLRSVGSTGSTLPPEGFDWVYQNIKKDIWLTSISGGTDVCSAFVGGNPINEVYRGEIQCRALGCDLQAWDENNQPVIERVGEMIIATPMPSMPVFFWGDTSGEKYRSSYFEKYKDVWRHGDWIEITTHHGVKILGRSDATLNRAGVRIGTSEIYAAIDEIKEIEESLIVCIERNNGSFYMPLYVKMKRGQVLSDDVKSKIKHTLKIKYTARHVPDEIVAVADIPYTISGKKLEMPVKKILTGTPIHEVIKLGSLRNPDSLKIFKELSIEIINK